MILDRLERDCISHFTSFVWFRFFANRGHAQRFRGEPEKAAQLFLRAHQFCPQLEQAGLIEVLAHDLLGNIDQARRLAENLRDKFPASPATLGLWIQTEPIETKFSELEKAIPSYLAGHAEVAIGLSHAAGMRADFDQAVFYAGRALEANPQSLPAKYVWAISIVMQNRQALARSEPRNKEQLKEARAILQEHIANARKYAKPLIVAHEYVNLAASCRLLDEEVAADEAIASAFALSPEDEDVRIQHAYVLLKQSKIDDAIKIIATKIDDAPLRRRLVWSQMMLERGNETDLADAINVLSHPAERLSKEPEDLQLSWTCTLVQCLLSAKQFDQAEQLLESSLVRAQLSEISRKTFLAMAASAQNNVEKAVTLASEAVEAMDARALPDELRQLANILRILNQKRLGLVVFKRLVTASSPMQEIHSAFRLAFAENDEDFILKLGGNLRAESRYDLHSIEAELAVLQRSSPQKAEAFLARLLNELPDGSVARHLRVALTHLGVDLKRPDLIEQNPDDLPRFDEIEEYQCAPTVAALRQTAQPLCAVEMAYNLVRKFPNSLLAHQAMMFSMFPIGGPVPQIPAVSKIEIGAAVLLHDEKAKTERWYLLEPTSEPLAILNEIPANGQMAQTLIGLSVGDEADIEEAFGTKRRVSIRKVSHRFAYRYTDCMEHLAARFPQQQLFKQFNIREDVPSDRAFDEMFQFMEDGTKNDQNALNDYRHQPMPLYVLSKRMGRSLIAAMEGVVTAKNGFLRCCQGTTEESNTASEWLCDANCVVIDATAAISWFFLDEMFGVSLVDALRGWKVAKCVAEKTFNDLRKILEDLKSGHDRLGIVRVGHNIIPRITPADQLDRAGEKLGRILQFFESNCEIVLGSTLSTMDPQAREQILKLCGRATAESIYVASSRSALLWTDDLTTAIFADHDFHVRRIWTQIAARKICDGALARKATLGLVSLQYEFTSLTPDDVINAAEEARWDCNAWPLRQVLDYFAKSSPNLEGLLLLAGQLLRVVWTHPVLGLQAQSVTLRLLDRIGSRQDGEQAARALFTTVDPLFGINVVVADQLKDSIQRWIARKKKPLII